MNRLKDKVVIITGAAGEMGAAEAKLFAIAGAKVLATDVQEEKLKKWVGEAMKEGLIIEYIRHDVTSETEWAIVCEKALSLFGKIDILVNNAGVFPGFIDCEQTTKELWDKVIAINLKGPFLGVKHAFLISEKREGVLL